MSISDIKITACLAILSVVTISAADWTNSTSPTLQYEQLRRRLETNINLYWQFSQASFPDGAKMKQLREHKNSLLSDLQLLRENDGHDQWRETEIKSLSEIVRKRLAIIQNPSDCSKARKVACTVAQTCGFGCQVHHLVICLLIAYATERTMVLEDEETPLYTNHHWRDVIKPLSNTCTSADGQTHGNWSNHFHPSDSVQVLHVPRSTDIKPRPDYLQLAIPQDLASRLVLVHGNPGAWWLSQFVKFILKLQPEIQQLIDEREKSINFSTPIVGIHIRRTDKLIRDAEFKPIKDYMDVVKDYYDQLQMSNQTNKINRRVFVASDDPSVLIRARQKYPIYEFIGADENTILAAAPRKRYSKDGLSGIILDTYMLAKCDYLVCTFSSNVCRLAFALKMAENPLDYHDVTSLDSEFFLWKGEKRHEVAVMEHSRGHMRPGDVILDTSNYTDRWQGITTGFNKNTRSHGRYPTFKLKEVVKVVQMPNYN